MTIVQDIYDHYRVPPWLQLHQRRVAALGKHVAEYHGIDVQAVTEACLLHDMGAIVKFDFSDSDEFAGVLYPVAERNQWRLVQDDIRRTYGAREYVATEAILREIGVSEVVLAIFANMGFARMRYILDSNFREAQAAQYADMRVSPRGISSLEERLGDVRERYGRSADASWHEGMEKNAREARELEERLRMSGLDLSLLSDESLADEIEYLKRFEITDSHG